MTTKEKILELKTQGKNIPEICNILKIGKGTVGYHLKNLGIKWNGKRTEEHKNKISKALKGKSRKHSSKTSPTQSPGLGDILKLEGSKSYNYWPVLNGEVKHIGTYHNSIRPSLKRFLIKHDIIPYKCHNCGCGDQWMGKTMPLILDHINGIKDDNVLENLRFLCSNCDSISDTYKGKNKK